MSHLLGKEGEAFAIKYLQKNGYEILFKNFRIRGSEIDIIAKISGIFVFVEVKARSNTSFGTGKDSITLKKFKHILKGIKYFFLVTLELEEIPEFRVDAIILEKSQKKFRVEHIQNIGEDDF